MKVSARVAAAVAASAAVLAEAITPDCAVTNKAYEDATVQSPNGAWTADAATCQTTCATSPTCTKFTWTPNSEPANGCWLYGESATEKDQDGAVSGPEACISVLTDASKTAAATDAKEQATKTIKEVFDEESTGASTEKSLVGGSGTDGGLPWYGIVGAGLGAAVVGAGAFALIGGGSDSSKKSKRGLKEEPGAPKKAWQLYAKMVDPSLQFDAESGKDAPAGFEMPPQVAGAGVQMASLQQIPQLAPLQPGYFNSQQAVYSQVPAYAYAAQHYPQQYYPQQ